MRLKINDILGAFMFGGEASEKKVKVLSGGERSRLAMIRLLLDPVNLLILDEPTNHLDMQSKDVLKEAIKAFDGTAIIVSHDREFLDGLVDKVYEFGGGLVKEHLGGIYDFLHNRNIASLDELNRKQANGDSQSAISNSKSAICDSKSAIREEQPITAKQAYADHKEQQKKIRKAERAVEESEKKIAELETRIKQLDEQLCKPENAANMELVNQYTDTKDRLDKEVERWEQLSEELESLI